MRLLLAILLTLPAPAMACTMGLTWTAPTQRENGQPLPRAEISRFEIRCVGLNVRGSVVKFAKGGTNGYRIGSAKLPAGRYSCVAITHDTDGVASIPSAAAQGECR